MRIKFLGDVFIHTNIHDLTVEPVGVLFKEVTTEVEEEMVEGKTFKGNNKWYKSTNGEFYFWSGRAKIVGAIGENNPSFSLNWTTLNYDKNKMNWAIQKLDLLEKFWKEWGLTGVGVKVAILDSGIDLTNPDLKPAVKAAKNFIAEADEKDITDEIGHGTKCAGLIGGRGFQKVFGIAPECELYIAKVGTKNKITTLESFSAALDWAKEMKVDIISMSTVLREGAFKRSATKKRQFQKKIDALHNAGILLVAATGNDNLAPDVIRYPSYFPNCLSINAIKKDGSLHPIVGKSKQVNFVAAGDDLLTTGLQSTIAKISQTSAAAACFSGILALLKQYINQSDNPSLSIADLQKILAATADYSGLDKCKDVQFGCGAINPIAAKEGIDLKVIG